MRIRTSPEVVAKCRNCPSDMFSVTFRLDQWFIICQRCESEYGLLADGKSHEMTNIASKEKTA